MGLECLRFITPVNKHSKPSRAVHCFVPAPNGLTIYRQILNDYDTQLLQENISAITN